MHNQLREPQPYEDCQAKFIQEFFTQISCIIFLFIIKRNKFQLLRMFFSPIVPYLNFQPTSISHGIW